MNDRIYNNVVYEYVAEPKDVHGDIIDPLFGDTLEEVMQMVNGYPCESVSFALVRNEGNEPNGLQDRGYAYFGRDMQIETVFDSGHVVPQRFLRKYNRAQ